MLLLKKPIIKPYALLNYKQICFYKVCSIDQIRSTADLLAIQGLVLNGGVAPPWLLNGLHVCLYGGDAPPRLLNGLHVCLYEHVNHRAVPTKRNNYCIFIHHSFTEINLLLGHSGLQTRTN